MITQSHDQLKILEESEKEKATKAILDNTAFKIEIPYLLPEPLPIMDILEDDWICEESFK